MAARTPWMLRWPRYNLKVTSKHRCRDRMRKQLGSIGRYKWLEHIPSKGKRRCFFLSLLRLSTRSYALRIRFSLLSLLLRNFGHPRPFALHPRPMLALSPFAFFTLHSLPRFLSLFFYHTSSASLNLSHSSIQKHIPPMTIT